MKKYLIFAASALALASCSSDDFLGDNPGNIQNATTAINFGGEAGKITRATAAEMLNGQFKVHGIKKGSDGNFAPVFNNYYVWDVADKNTTSNTNGWEYVGKAGATNLGTGHITLPNTHDQTIKYWDYSASEYHFVAGSPINVFKANPSPIGSPLEINTATVTDLAGHIKANNTTTALKTDPVYIADPVKVVKANYQDPVTFTFKRQQSMVRVGIYETIPGYTITGINFYAYDTDGNHKVTTDNNIILTSSTEDYFVGGSNIGGKVNYIWTTATPSYTFEYTDANLTKSKNWYAGKLENGVEATTSSETDVTKLYGKDGDMASTTGYFTVLPTQVATASPILIKCDYELTADDHSGETIKVTGATAAIPAAFSKWEANTRYTYLFKISQATNGTTGDPSNPNDPAGLFPITFNAIVTTPVDGTVGTTTTVATPSITTHQAGSVTDKGIEYKTGTAIDVTVTNDKGEVQPLTTGGTAVGNVAVYKFTDAITEAEIQVKGLTGATAVTGTVDSNVLKFTPESEGYYAIQYLTKAAIADPVTPAAYTYKVVYVKEAPTVTPAP